MWPSQTRATVTSSLWVDLPIQAQPSPYCSTSKLRAETAWPGRGAHSWHGLSPLSGHPALLVQLSLCTHGVAGQQFSGGKHSFCKSSVFPARKSWFSPKGQASGWFS